MKYDSVSYIPPLGPIHPETDRRASPAIMLNFGYLLQTIPTPRSEGESNCDSQAVITEVRNIVHLSIDHQVILNW